MSKRPQTLSDLALAVQNGTLEIDTLPDKVRTKIRRLGPIAMGGSTVNDSPRQLRDSHGPMVRRAHAS